MESENLERWRYYMQDIISPNSYIDMGFYFMISSALQRRVYLGHDERPLFPNLYILLIGRPGIGKGLVIKPITNLLKFHKHKDRDKEYGTLGGVSGNGAAAIKDVEDIIDSLKTTGTQYLRDKHKEESLIFPVSADSITYECLVQEHATSVRYHKVPIEHPFVKKGYYRHCSLIFLLEEISTLFRKHTEDVTRYLLKAYDCEDYEHKTKHFGIDSVRRGCLSLLGGTTPDFILEAFNDKLLNEGFASRAISVFESSPRFYRFDMAHFNDEQLGCKTFILKHLFNLYKLFGKVEYSPEAYEFLRYYVEEVLPNCKVNRSPKLDHYYARKNIHLQKLAMAIHFADSTEMVLPLWACEKALSVLNSLEVKMDQALHVSGKNPVGTAAVKIERVLECKGPLTFTEIWGLFIHDLDQNQMLEAITYLIQAGKIVSNKTDYKNPKGQTVEKYELPRREQNGDRNTNGTTEGNPSKEG